MLVSVRLCEIQLDYPLGRAMKHGDTSSGSLAMLLAILLAADGLVRHPNAGLGAMLCRDRDGRAV